MPLERANVRVGPGLNYKIIDTWPLAKEVRVISKETKNWYRINYKNQRSALMHKTVITDRPIAINILENGWEKSEGEGGLPFMLAFKPYVRLKITSLSPDPITSLTLKMLIKEGRKVYSSDKFEVDVSEKRPLMPDRSIVRKITSTARKELLTRPDQAYVIIYGEVGDEGFEVYREFYLEREVVNEGG